MRLIIIIVILNLLSACGNTPQSINMPDVNVIEPLFTTTQSKKSAYELSQSIENALNNNKWAYINSIISVELMSSEYEQLVANRSLSESELNMGQTLKPKILSSLKQSSTNFSWKYLFTQVSKKCLCQRYRLDSDDGYNFVTIKFDPISQQMFDVHLHVDMFSVLEFMSEFTNLVNQVPEFAYTAEQRKAITNLVVQNKEIDSHVLSDALQKAPSEFMNKPVMIDFLTLILRISDRMNKTSVRDILIKHLDKQNITLFLLENHYVDTSQYDKAISSLFALPDFAKNDVKMQMEISLLEAYRGDFEQAYFHLRKAMFADPKDVEVPFIGLQIAILAKEYKMATDILNYIAAKYEYIVKPEDLTDFDDATTFIDSEAFKTWQSTGANI